MNERPKVRYKTIRHARPWLDEENARLRELILGGNTLGQIAQEMNRTETAIKQRANRLNFSISDNLNLRALRNRKHTAP